MAFKLKQCAQSIFRDYTETQNIQKIRCQNTQTENKLFIMRALSSYLVDT